MLHLGPDNLSPGTEDAAMKLVPCHVFVGVFRVSNPSVTESTVVFPQHSSAFPPSHRARRAVIKSHLTAAEKAEFPAGNDFFELFAIKTKLT